MARADKREMIFQGKCILYSVCTYYHVAVVCTDFLKGRCGKKKKGTYKGRVLTTVEGTLARALAPERAFEGTLVHILAPERAL